MSDTTIETTSTETTTAKKGPKRRTEDELRAAFAEMKSTIGADGLCLQVDSKQRCTVVHKNGDVGELVLGPVAGNTFMQYVRGAALLARFAS